MLTGLLLVLALAGGALPRLWANRPKAASAPAT
jgi:hypothetical protein